MKLIELDMEEAISLQIRIENLKNYPNGELYLMHIRFMLKPDRLGHRNIRYMRYVEYLELLQYLDNVEHKRI